MGVEAVAAALAAAMFPVPCVGCGAGDRPLCPACRARLRPVPVVRRLAAGLEVRSGLAYDGVARRVVLAVKEHGRTSLAAELAPALRCALAGWGADAVPCIVPSSGAGRRRRGFDPVAVVLRHAGAAALPLLAAPGAGAAQKTLGAEARTGNRRGAFRALAAAAGRRVLLVDDVVTTGATLEAAAEALRAAGAVVAGAATIAATPRRR